MPDFDPAIAQTIADAKAHRAHLEQTVDRLCPPPRSTAEIHADMARCRIDVWERAFSGVFRLHLPTPLVLEVETAHGPLAKLYAGLTGDGSTAMSKAVTTEAARAVVRAALTGGGVGIVSGEQVVVSPITAARLTATLEDEPLATTWQLARAALEPRLMGRVATEEEAAVWSLDSQNAPVVPEWAGLAA
jgi:hypothetical protein